MGGKESKGRLPSLADIRESGMSRDDLAAYLTSVSDMIETGHKRNTVPEIRVNNQPVLPPATESPGPDLAHKKEATAELAKKSSARGQLRHKLEKQLSADKPAEHISRQLELLDGLDSQDDSQDWAHMRDWLLYHMHENLDDSDEDVITASAASIPSFQPPQRRPLHRQMSMDKGRITQRLRLAHQGSSTSSSGGRTSAQNSFDSTGTGRTSYQNSFDSTGTGGADS